MHYGKCIWNLKINDFTDVGNKCNQSKIFIFVWFDIEKADLSVRRIYKLQSAVIRSSE